MKIILLDTNMLMGIGMLKLDIFSEIQRICDFRHEIATLDSNIVELKGIEKKQKGKYKKAAKLALQLLARKKVRVIESGIMPADDGIVQIATDSKDDLIVATQDISLKKRLKAKNIPIIALRQKKYLILR